MAKSITRTQEEESDHNLLISVNGKVDEIKKTIADMNDGMRTRVRDVETRINTLETIVDKVDPLNTYKEFLAVKEQVGYMKFTLYLIGVLGFIISWTTGFVSDIINFINK